MSDQPKKVIKAMMVCAMGMSSSLLEIKTREAAAKAGVPFEIKAVAVGEITRWDPGSHPVDIVLVAPQVFYKRKALELVGERHGIIVQGIDPMVFGMVDGDKLFDQIIKAVTARDEAKEKAKAPSAPAAAADAKTKEPDKAGGDAKPSESPKPASSDAKPKEALKTANTDATAKEPAKAAAKVEAKAKEPAKK